MRIILVYVEMIVGLFDSIISKVEAVCSTMFHIINEKKENDMKL